MSGLVWRKQALATEIANLIEDLRSHILDIREADKLWDSTNVLVGEREIILTELKVPPPTP